MVSASYRWGLGQCLSLSNSLDEEDVWSPCEGRSKSGGHNQYGFCQAGVSASVNKVSSTTCIRQQHRGLVYQTHRCTSQGLVHTATGYADKCGGPVRHKCGAGP